MQVQSSVRPIVFTDIYRTVKLVERGKYTEEKE